MRVTTVPFSDPQLAVAILRIHIAPREPFFIVRNGKGKQVFGGNIDRFYPTGAGTKYLPGLIGLEINRTVYREGVIARRIAQAWCRSRKKQLAVQRIAMKLAFLRIKEHVPIFNGGLFWRRGATLRGSRGRLGSRLSGCRGGRVMFGAAWRNGCRWLAPIDEHYQKKQPKNSSQGIL